MRWWLVPVIAGLWLGLQPTYRDAPAPRVGTYHGDPFSLNVTPALGDHITGFRLVTWGEEADGICLISRLVTAKEGKTYEDGSVMLLYPEVVYYKKGKPVIISRGTIGKIDLLGDVSIKKQRTWIKSTKTLDMFKEKDDASIKETD